jgi:hypothetical protein
LGASVFILYGIYMAVWLNGAAETSVSCCLAELMMIYMLPIQAVIRKEVIKNQTNTITDELMDRSHDTFLHKLAGWRNGLLLSGLPTQNHSRKSSLHPSIISKTAQSCKTVRKMAMCGPEAFSLHWKQQLHLKQDVLSVEVKGEGEVTCLSLLKILAREEHYS